MRDERLFRLKLDLRGLSRSRLQTIKMYRNGIMWTKCTQSEKFNWNDGWILLVNVCSFLFHVCSTVLNLVLLTKKYYRTKSKTFAITWDAEKYEINSTKVWQIVHRRLTCQHRPQTQTQAINSSSNSNNTIVWSSPPPYWTRVKDMYCEI